MVYFSKFLSNIYCLYTSLSGSAAENAYKGLTRRFLGLQTFVVIHIIENQYIYSIFPPTIELYASSKNSYTLLKNKSYTIG